MFRVNNVLIPISLALLSNSAGATIAFDDVSIQAGFSGTRTESWGANWGDLDGDGYPDMYTNNHRNRATLFRNNKNGTFTDISRKVDLSKSDGWTGGRASVDMHGDAWGDIDNDGDQDLYVSVSSSTEQLFINNGGLMTESAIQFGLGDMDQRADRMGVLFDYNGDGRLDIFTSALRSPGLYPQQSNGTFDARQKILMDCSDNAFAHLADVDPKSPGLELLCGPRTGLYPDKVYSFSSGTIKYLTNIVPLSDRVNDAVTADFNGDLHPDIFEVTGSPGISDAVQVNSNRIESNMIVFPNEKKTTSFKTSGKVTFFVSSREGTPRDGDPAYIDIGSSGYSPSSLTFTLDPQNSKNWGLRNDSLGLNIGFDPNQQVWTIQYIYNTDRYKESFIGVDSDQPINGLTFTGKSKPDILSSPILFMSRPSGYVNTTAASGLNEPILCNSAATGDFDNDMDEDIFITCAGGAQNIPNILYENIGNGTFQAVPNAGGAAGITGPSYGGGTGAGSSENVVLADYDLDGFLDLFVTNGSEKRPLNYGGPKELFKNKGNSNHWIELDLEGVASNRDGIGALIYVTSGGKTQYRESNGGYHRWAQNFKRIHVGLAENTQADIKVVWPNGSIDNLTNVAANALYKVTQGGNIAPVPH